MVPYPFQLVSVSHVLEHWTTTVIEILVNVDAKAGTQEESARDVELGSGSSHIVKVKCYSACYLTVEFMVHLKIRTTVPAKVIYFLRNATHRPRSFLK